MGITHFALPDWGGISTGRVCDNKATPVIPPFLIKSRRWKRTYMGTTFIGRFWPGQVINDPVMIIISLQS